MQQPLSLERPLDEIDEGIRKGVNVFVVGPTGSGRRALLAELSRRLPKALTIDLLPLSETDAPSVAILEACRAVGLIDAIVDGADAIYDAARAVAKQLEAQSDGALVLRVPRDWARIARKDEVDDPMLAQANSLLRGLTSTRATVIVVADEHFDRQNVVPGAMRVVRLPRRSLSLEQLEQSQDWGPLRVAAEALRSRSVVASPVVLRLAVGAVASGVAIDEVVAWMNRSDTARLTEAIVATVERSIGGVEIIGILAALRSAVPLSALAQVLPTEPLSKALVTCCLGYGDDPFRISDDVLAVLREGHVAAPDDHFAVAKVHRSLDGASSPNELRTQQRVRHWAEKVHHLGAAGEAAVAEWSEQQLPSPAFYWDRARALSMRGDFVASSDAYRACVAKFPEDDYGWHYLGYNLEQCGGPPKEVEDAYRRAVQFAPYKTWWHGRLVSFLIQQRSFEAAKASWLAALPNLMHDGRLCRDPILAAQLHRWVARHWLDAGRIDDAEQTLASVDRSIIEDDRALAEVAQDIRRARRTNLEQRFLEHGPSTQDARHAAVAQLKSLFQAHDGLGFPAIEPVNEALRMTWDNGQLLAQLEIEEGFDLEWYARDHRTKESEAGVGDESLPKLHVWLKRVSA
jgi:hypothetical protein